MPTIKEELQIVHNELEQRKSENQTLRESNQELSEEVEKITEERDLLLSYKNITEPDFSSAKTKLAEAEEQIKVLELRRFASAYQTQEKEYREEQKKWFSYIIGSSVFLAGSILFSIFIPHQPQNNLWYQEPGFYLLDAMFLTLFVYSLKKHSHLGNLIVDYANRKTLAQSYQYIVESGEESSDLESKFQERVAEIITAQPAVQDGKVTIYEHLFDQFTSKFDTLIATLKNTIKG